MRTFQSLVAVVALAAASVACHRAPSTSEEHRSAQVAAARSGASIYPLDVALRDQDGAAIGADVFRGHPVIVTMFYGSCPTACPLLVSHVKEVEASLPPEVRADTRVLIVSFDPDRDTPDALRELARAHHVDATRWRFAVASTDDARVLANALGINYAKREGGVFAHDSVITVLDREGKIVARSDDPRAPRAPLAAALTRVDRS